MKIAAMPVGAFFFDCDDNLSVRTENGYLDTIKGSEYPLEGFEMGDYTTVEPHKVAAVVAPLLASDAPADCLESKVYGEVPA